MGASTQLDDSGNNDNINLANSASGSDLKPTNPEITICFHVRWTAIPSSSGGDRTFDHHFGNDGIIIRARNTNELRFDYQDNDFAGITSSTSISINTWYFVACTYDGANIIIQVDEVETSFSNARSNPVSHSNKPVRIGAEASNPNALGSNIIWSDFHFYNRHLTLAERNELRWHPKSIAKGLKCYISGRDDSYKDESGNGNHGTAEGPDVTLSSLGPPISFPE